MSKTQMVGRLGGVHDGGGGHYLKAAITGAESTVSGLRYCIRLIDPPPALAAMDNCILVGKCPSLPNGINIMVVHHQRNQFIFKSVTENALPAGQNIGGADTQPGMAIKMARITSSPTLSGLGEQPRPLISPVVENGLFFRFPSESGKILLNGEILLLPEKHFLPRENPQHEDRLDFVRLNHTFTYQDGRGIQACCSAGYFRMMEKIVKLLRSETVFSADMKQALPALDYARRNPGLKKLDLAQVTVWQVFPKELEAEFGYSLPAVFAQFIKDPQPGTVHFKLLLETEGIAAEKTRIFSPYTGSVVDLIHDLMDHDFRAIVVKKE